MTSQVFIILVILGVSYTALGQGSNQNKICPKNEDFDRMCKTNFRFRSLHVFPNNINILMDSYSYSDLSSTFNMVDVDGDGSNWVQTGGVCSYNLRACTFKSPTPQDNWVLTHYVPYLEAQRVYVNVSYRFTQCTNNEKCQNDFVTLNRYDVEGEKEGQQVNTHNYTEMVTLQQEGRRTVSTHLTFERPENANGFYLGVRDFGTCGQVNRILVYYENAAGYIRDDSLVTCPCIAYPKAEGEINSKECTCHANAQPMGGVLQTVDHSGAVSGVPECGCKPGYEFTNGACQPCPPGTFKATLSNTDKCTECPASSFSLFPATTVCECACGKVRPASMPEAPCKSPPSAPRLDLMNAPMYNDNHLNVCWLPATEDGGNSDSLQYNIYEFQEEKYVKIGVKQESYCFEFIPASQGKATNVIITSETDSTDNKDSITDSDEVKGRFIALQIISSEPSVAATTPPAPPSTTPPAPPSTTLPPPPSTTLPATTAKPTEEASSTTAKPNEVVSSGQKPYFQLGSIRYEAGASIPLNSIGEGQSALRCVTLYQDCCKSKKLGEFYDSGDNLVPVRARNGPLYRNRGEGFIRLNYRKAFGSVKAGNFCCRLPDSEGEESTVCITLE